MFTSFNLYLVALMSSSIEYMFRAQAVVVRLRPCDSCITGHDPGAVTLQGRANRGCEVQRDSRRIAVSFPDHNQHAKLMAGTLTV